MTTLQNIPQNAAQKEVLINGNFSSTAKSAVFSRKPQADGTRYYYYGGIILGKNSEIIEISDNYITCTDNSLNYIQYDMITKTIIRNSTGFIQRNIPIATVNCSQGLIINYVNNIPENLGMNTSLRKTFLNTITLSTTIALTLTDVDYNIQNTGTEYIYSVKLIAVNANSQNTLNEEITAFADIAGQKTNIQNISYFDKVNKQIKVIIPSALFIYSKSTNDFIPIPNLTDYRILTKVN